MIFNIQLTDDDINFIGTLLDEAPYKLVKPLADRLQAQINAQLAPEVANPEPAIPDVMDLATGQAEIVPTPAPAEQGS